MVSVVNTLANTTENISGYNLQGRPTSYRGWNLSWTNGRVTSFTKNGVTNTCEYDANGIRIKKVANGLSHEYYLEDKRIVREVVTGGNNYELWYMYGSNGIVGFTYKKNGTSTNYYYRKNLLGDIVAIYGENGTKYAQYAYDAWGSCTVLSDTNGIGALNPFRYRGYYWDSELGLYYLNARYYDPEVGRFISQDDISYLAPQTLNGINLYAYCLNNPVMGTDPEGTWSWKGFGMVVAAVAIVAAVAVATAVTAGAAGAAIAGIAGFSTLGVQAVGTVVGVTALTSGIVVGSNEIAKQITEKGAEDINLLSVTISTVGGGIDGAFVAGSLFTVDPMKTSFLYAGRIVA